MACPSIMSSFAYPAALGSPERERERERPKKKGIEIEELAEVVVGAAEEVKVEVEGVDEVVVLAHWVQDG